MLAIFAPVHAGASTRSAENSQRKFVWLAGASRSGAFAITVDSAGNLYLADGEFNRIHEVSGGVINSVAGNGTVGDGSPSTNVELNNWMQVPEFNADYRKTRRDAFHQAVARLQQASSAAVTTLLKLAVDPNAPAAVKARAAYYILTLGTKAMETEDIDASGVRSSCEASAVNWRS